MTAEKISDDDSLEIVDGLCAESVFHAEEFSDVTRTFYGASDEAITALISTARHRLIVVAPALTHSVAAALARRLDDLGKLDVTVILDADPEVYRLGFGDQNALDIIRAASATSQFDLRQHAGIRIGIIVADDTAMVYAPISKNIEAGSTSAEKPNAVLLAGDAAGRIASAAGAYAGEGKVQQRPREVGSNVLAAGEVEKMQKSLVDDPPRPFDITRKLNVFSSKVQYVEIKVSNYQISKRQIPLPQDLIDVTDPGLRDRISARIGLPLDGIGALKITIEHNGRAEELKVDEQWLNRERRRIAEQFTFPVAKFGRLILHNERAAFKQAMSRFERIVDKYQAELHRTLVENRSRFEQQIVDEYLPRWEQNPPARISRIQRPTPDILRSRLHDLARRMFDDAIAFEPPVVKVLYKNVAPENLLDDEFMHNLKASMTDRAATPADIDSLFETGQAAPATGTFLSR